MAADILRGARCDAIFAGFRRFRSLPMSASPAPVLADTGSAGPADIPNGFSLLDTGGPYLRAMGTLYARRADNGTAVIAIRVAPNHLNVQGVTHGGMLTTLADGALGINLAIARGRRGGHVTVSLNADFLSGAREGDWLEAHVGIARMGKRLCYANCDLRVGERHILRANAVFAFVERTLPPTVDGTPPLIDG